MTHSLRLCCLTAALAASALAPLTAQAVAIVPSFDLASGQGGSVGSSTATGINGSGSFALAAGSSYGYVSTAGSTFMPDTPAVKVNIAKDGTAYGEQNGSVATSQVFQAQAGDSLTMRFNYVSTDGRDFADYAWARLVNAGSNTTAAWLFTARSNNKGTGQILGSLDVAGTAPELDTDGWSFNTRDADGNGSLAWAPIFNTPQDGLCYRNASGCGFTGWLTSTSNFSAQTAGSYRIEVGVLNYGDDRFNSGLAFSGFSTAAVTAVPEPGQWALLLSGLAAMLVLRRRMAR